MGMINQLSGPVRRQLGSLSAFTPLPLWAAIVLSSHGTGRMASGTFTGGGCFWPLLASLFHHVLLVPFRSLDSHAQSFLLRVPLLLVCGPTLNAISSYKPSLAFQAKASDSLLVLKLRCLQAPSLSLSKLIFIVFKGSVAVLLLECKQQKSRVPMSAIWLLSVTICLVGNCRGRTASQVFSFMVSQFVSCRMGILLVVAVTN